LKETDLVAIIKMENYQQPKVEVYTFTNEAKPRNKEAYYEPDYKDVREFHAVS